MTTRFLSIGTLAVAVAVCVCVAAVATPAATGRPQATFRAASDAVRVFVTVTDREGQLVTTLSRDDFEVRDEGKPQPITLFDNTPQPVRLIVMLDVSGSMEGNLSLLRGAAEELFSRLGPADVARVGSFGREVVISPSFTRDPDALRTALPRAIAPDAPTPLWRAVDEAMDGFGAEREVRPVVLVLSDGKDSGPTGFRQRYVSQAEIVDRARREDVMVYGIGMRSRSARQMPGIGPGGLQAALMADFPDPGLALVAEQTGGGYREIRVGQDLGTAFAQVLDELHSQYLIGFAPPKRDGKVHDIDVRVAQRGLKPRARRSYLAPKDQKQP
jgi:Ca-activated chloride channel family protein